MTENTSYYIFTQCPDGAFEAFPVHNWYNFTPLAKHRTLTAEEAEEEWERRVRGHGWERGASPQHRSRLGAGDSVVAKPDPTSPSGSSQSSGGMDVGPSGMHGAVREPGMGEWLS